MSIRLPKYNSNPDPPSTGQIILFNKNNKLVYEKSDGSIIESGSSPAYEIYDKNDDYTLTSSDCNGLSIYTNSSASNDINIILPSPVLGLRVIITNTNTQNYKIQIQTNSIIIIDGLTLNFLNLELMGQTIELYAINNSTWVCTKSNLNYSIITKLFATNNSDVIFISTQDKLFAWSGTNWVRGDGNNINKNDAQLILPLTPNLMAFGTSRTMAVIDNNHIFSWGYNKYGGLGLGNSNTATYKQPTIIPYWTKSIISLIGCLNTSAILDDEYYLWTWGDNQYGQLGHNVLNSYLTPVSIPTNNTFKSIISNIADNSCGAIDINDMTWTWGDNTFGQLGNNSKYDKYTPTNICDNKTFTKLVSGFGFFVGIDNNNQLWSWGHNIVGQLGDNTRVDRSVPVAVCNNLTFSQLAVGVRHLFGITSSGTAYGWGNNSYGQLGINDTTSRLTPIAICGGLTLCQISAGQGHTVAIDYTGKLWAWGYNNYGQLGDNSVTSKLTPIAVCTNLTFCKIACGYVHTLAITNSGTLMAWGYNTSGQLGDGTTTSKVTPVAVCTALSFSQLTAGDSISAGIYNNNIYSWGYNYDGQLGVNSTTNKSTPVIVCGTNTFCQVQITNFLSMLALDNNGQLWTWGKNSPGGHLGLGGSLAQNQLTKVNKTFKQISCGIDFMVGLDFDNNAWSWGSNQYGQLGNNTDQTSCFSPVAVCGNITFSKLYCCYRSSFGIDNTGKLWSWGQNIYGQLGDGTNISRLTPVAVCGNHTFSYIVCGFYHVVGVDNTGKLWSWGQNSYGQLGANIPVTTASRLTPVAVCTNVTFCDLVCTSYHSMGLDVNNQLWGWGYNNTGQLSNLDLSRVLTPILINTKMFGIQ